MPLGQQLATTSSGYRGKRYRTAGPGTLRVFDFKNKDTYPSGITPASALPDGTSLKDLPDLSAAQQALAFIRGATVQSANGGITVGGSAKRVQLPADFEFPALSGQDGHYLILLGLRFASAAAPGSAQYIAGWATNSTTNCNWLLYQNSGNANLFCNVGASFLNFGAPPDTGAHRYGIEVIRDGTAGTLMSRGWRDGLSMGFGTGVSAASIAQPTTISPAVGASGYGTGSLGPSSGNFDVNSAEICNLLTDGSSLADTTVVQSIVAEDFTRWGTRFG